MSDPRDIREQILDLTTRSTGLGSLSEAITDTFYGFNHGLLGNPVPYNTENQGLTFITRPRLNLSYDNLAMDRFMMTLASDRPDTVQSAIRAYLDPEENRRKMYEEAGKLSQLVDPYNAFIPLLSNTLLSLNGWPDMQVGSHTSKAGVYHETWSMVDDTAMNYRDYELTANFRNIKGDPITALFAYWILYSSNVYLGKMMPYLDSVTQNEIDYTTRIYRITLDETRRYVQKIAACGYGYPIGAPIGASVNFNSDTPMNMETATQVSIGFKCQGFMWNDPFLIYAFNRTVGMFNPQMRIENLRNRSSLMVKLTLAERDVMRGYGYPRIEPRTNELCWYVSRMDYDRLMSGSLPDTIELPAMINV